MADLLDQEPEEREESLVGVEAPVGEIVEAADDEETIKDTDIVFDCPHCGHGLVIDYRGAGLVTNCTECGKPVQVPIPDGMELNDLDQPPQELESQILNLRRAHFKSEQRSRELEDVVASLKERRTALERLRGADLHRLAEIRSACEHIQRLQAETATVLGRILDLISAEPH